MATKPPVPDLVILPAVLTTEYDPDTGEVTHPTTTDGAHGWDTADGIPSFRVYSVKRSESLGLVYRFHGDRWKYTTDTMSGYSSPFPTMSEAANACHRRFMSTTTPDD